MGPVPGTSPIVPVRDVAQSVAFYSEMLGFDLSIHNADAGYALLRRGPAMIALIGGADERALRATATNISAQIWLNDLDGYWDQIKDRADEFPAGSLRPPFDRDYGVRELHVKDPDGFLIFFTELTDSEKG
ncbi:MAG: VOC family protein [Pseudomonadota bacterium]